MDDKTEHRERALKKLKRELQKDIGTAARLSQICGIWELLRLGFLLHIVRLQTHLEDQRASMNYAQTLSMHLSDDAIKYAISLVARNGQWRAKKADIQRDGPLNNELVIELVRICQHINMKFEFEALIPIADVTVSGERDQDCAIDMESILRVPERARMIFYGFRLDAATYNGKNRTFDAEPLLEMFENEFAEVDDLFRLDTGLSLHAYCDGLRRLVQLARTKMQAAEGKSVMLNNGNLDVLHARTFYELSRASVLGHTELLEAVGHAFFEYMRRTRFRSEEVNNSELRFHYLSRKPYLFGDGVVVVFPALILDSVFIHTHFSLLERLESKPTYIERRSKWFVDEIASKAALHGFAEVGRDIYLKEGKKDYGDIDLVLRHQPSNKYLLIEAKNHALPLDVYFRSYIHTEAHLKRTSDWEKKVKGRLGYLARRHTEVGITGPYSYLIVSLHPEILSHVSEVLTLSIDEFDLWMGAGCEPNNFEDFYQKQYQTDSLKMSEDDLLQLHQDGFSLMRPHR